MNHFTSSQNVKETEGVCFQRFTTVSKFARTRPPDFYFRMMAFTEGKNELFVQIFQQLTAGVNAYEHTLCKTKNRQESSAMKGHESKKTTIYLFIPRKHRIFADGLSWGPIVQWIEQVSPKD